MTELIGYLAALCFAASGVPFAIRVVRAGRTDMAVSGILLILVGSMGMLSYTLMTSRAAPLLVDFVLNSACWGSILFYRLFPRTLV